jgi:Uma2 family endonuclease
MAAGTLISVDEYLRTSYSPDKEYVDGVLLERLVGEKPHSRIQRNLIIALAGKYPAVRIWPELRMQTVADRHRIPDVSLTLTEPEGNILREPPFIAIEILSAEDTVTRLIEKLKEYEAVGTPNIWVFDPRLRQMFIFRSNALCEVTEEIIVTSDGAIQLTRQEIFRD